MNRSGRNSAGRVNHARVIREQEEEYKWEQKKEAFRRRAEVNVVKIDELREKHDIAGAHKLIAETMGLPPDFGFNEDIMKNPKIRDVLSIHNRSRGSCAICGVAIKELTAVGFDRLRGNKPFLEYMQKNYLPYFRMFINKMLFLKNVPVSQETYLSLQDKIMTQISEKEMERFAPFICHTADNPEDPLAAFLNYFTSIDKGFWPVCRFCVRMIDS